MFWNSTKAQSLFLMAAETLRVDWQTRDQDASFAHAVWQKLFSHADFAKLDFTSVDAHRFSTESMMADLYAVARGGMDLPFAASVAAQAAIGPELLANFGSAEVKLQVLPKVQSGEQLLAICNSEQGSGTNLRAMKSLCTFDAVSGAGTLRSFKPLATNAFGAKRILVSAWAQNISGGDPTMELFLVDAERAQTGNVAGQLSGFRTGNCGSVEIKEAHIDVNQARLGPAGSGVAVFKHCFDGERLYLAVLVAGVLHGVEDLAIQQLAARPSLYDKQYVQEKLLAISAVRTKLLALVTLAMTYPQLADAQVELSLLKWMCAADAPLAVQAVADLNGWTSMNENNILNKIARDFQGLRYFGGTIELQKMNMFAWLTRHLGNKNAKAA